MSRYLNPGNSGFERILKGKYVDKTGLIGLINSTIDTADNLTCVSRPRRFGKSFAAQMLCAYYDCSCDSHALFCGKNAGKLKDYEKHLNQYNVVYLDITGFISEVKQDGGNIRNVPAKITESLRRELESAWPELREEISFLDCLAEYVRLTGRKIVFIIDEWDAMIREAKEDPTAQGKYLNLLRGWFKNGNFTPKVVAAAYMTGILPIKKDGSQSAISDFNEYTMLNPFSFGEYIGFTEEEVQELCMEYNVDFQMVKRWYDGYYVRNTGCVYNPNSVMKALRYREFNSYWTETSAAEGLMEYIGKDYEGLSRTVAELIGGVEVRIDPGGFANDLTTFRGKDDVLTLLVHFGYLSYDARTRTVHIPNEEIRLEFSKSVRVIPHAETVRRLQESDRLFYDTIHGNEEAVAAQIEKVHTEETEPRLYNNEQALRSVIKLAYYTYKDNYLQWEELPAGAGYADVVYLPRHDSGYPALVIELKWNKSSEGAIAQILDRNYPDALKGYGSDILLVGVNYDKDAPAGKRKHTCRIIRVR